MARHRVGDSYLSDEEYAEHRSWNWKCWLFLIAGLFTALAMYSYTKNIDIKLFRFVLVICPSIFFGYLAARFSEIIFTILGIAVASGFLYFIAALIWSAM